MSVSITIDTVKVQTGLFSLSEAVRERLADALRAVSQDIIRATRAGWAGHHRSGKLEASLTSRVRVYGDQAVWATISAGGRRAPYAHLFERGFTGQEQVGQHTRTSRLGLSFTVREYARSVTYPVRDYMGQALSANKAAAEAAVARAVDGAIQEAGLA